MQRASAHCPSVAHFFPSLRRAIRRYAVDEDEVLQTLRTHLLIDRKLAAYSGRGALERWLRAVVVRLALKARARKKTPAAHLASDDFLLGEDPELAHLKDAYRHEFKKALDHALAGFETARPCERRSARGHP